MRREATLELEWENIDFVNNVITTRHTPPYLHEKGVFEEESKSTSCWFYNFVEANDLSPISIYGLQHTNASIMISSSVPITTTTKRLGHSTSATTSKIYVHAIASTDVAAASTIQAVISLRRGK